MATEYWLDALSRALARGMSRQEFLTLVDEGDSVYVGGAVAALVAAAVLGQQCARQAADQCVAEVVGVCDQAGAQQ